MLRKCACGEFLHDAVARCEACDRENPAFRKPFSLRTLFRKPPYPSGRRWVMIWAATLVFLAALGGARWPALFQTREERYAYYRDKWVADVKKAPGSQNAFGVFQAVVNHMGQADDDVRFARRLALFSGGVIVVLATWQIRGRRRQP